MNFRKRIRYLSQIFKEKTGMGLLEYMNNYRISIAEKLLSDGSHTVDEVAMMVGYASGSSFRRNFRKITGVTPGKYRK